jgi:D-glycero-alpha-D-manno-heptose 1-phosphate guanylyltransferase
MHISEAIILAGGLGTRLKEVVHDVPKVMAPVNGRPFLEYILDYLNHEVFTHVVLSVGYKHDIIINHFGNQYKSISIDYAIEEQPLGTGGGIKKAFEKVKGRKALVLNGDTMFAVNLDKLVSFHFAHQSNFTMALRQLDNVERYGSVSIDLNQRIYKFEEKGEYAGEGLINGGVYIINKKFFEENEFPDKFSIEKDAFEKMYLDYPFYGVICHRKFIDIGIPEDYKRAQDEFKEFHY